MDLKFQWFVWKLGSWGNPLPLSPSPLPTSVTEIGKLSWIFPFPPYWGKSLTFSYLLLPLGSLSIQSWKSVLKQCLWDARN
jgi:hypothetical protein